VQRDICEPKSQHDHGVKLVTPACSTDDSVTSIAGSVFRTSILSLAGPGSRAFDIQYVKSHPHGKENEGKPKRSISTEWEEGRPSLYENLVMHEIP
jgi:hypothetical protein